MNIAQIGLLSVVFLGSPSFADMATADDNPHQPNRVVVSTRDLDLSTDAGVRTAQARVRRAAEQACGDYPRVGLLPPAAVARCRMIAARDANARIAILAGRASDGGVMLADRASHAR